MLSGPSPRILFSVIAAATLVLVGLAVARFRATVPPQSVTSEPALTNHAVEPRAEPLLIPLPSALTAGGKRQPGQMQPQADSTSPILSKAARMDQVRETFRVLARGDALTALRAARQLADENEREAGLLELVMAWKKGELSSPRQRAQAIASFGLEAGLGIELVQTPDLAAAWANELTEEKARAALIEHTANALFQTDPNAAFALTRQMDSQNRRQFLDAIFAGWARQDTDLALKWAEQQPDPEDSEAAMRAIHSVAPVGIGAEMSMEDGYAIIKGLVPGAAAELSGQIHPGDRILSVAQGDNSFVDARGVPLKDLVELIRGAPGTIVQVQILPAGDPTAPRTVSVVRGQLKFKN